ncbi:helix-turn-helix domain-containing protein [uncultured Alistipes sp.]|jgi:hypothetical protein|uniref:helix-turn-helix domain-containing protein n=1 Tax=uncultured Alistipes sp. TaxID=538949 RepID=UPI00260049D3|nr:helix-turn-helix domain-containing protein [uncultured Alistipes sp.]
MKSDPNVTNCQAASATPGEEEIFVLARQKMECEKRYLDPALTMESLAAEMCMHRNKLSHAVNKFAGVSFPTWLSCYRVEEVERLASLPENRGRRLSDIAYDAGFADHASFYRAFVRLRHMKPSAALRHQEYPEPESVI